MKLIFILSLPRSGSTLLQRALSTHKDIATVSEPWIMLPMLYSLKCRGVSAEYGHQTLSAAIQDFCSILPNGEKDYYDAIRELAEKLYKKAVGQETSYFIDKTPRYYLIADGLMKAFPDSKYIVLWRNPLSCVASYFHSYGNKWRLYNYGMDFYKGIPCLLKFREENRNSVCEVNYEDLVSTAARDSCFQRIFQYLDIKYDKDILNNISDVKLNGRMGDKSGVAEYSVVTSESTERWISTMSNPVRRLWARKYVEWLGCERLQMMGYRQSDLLKEIRQAPINLENTCSDISRVLYGALYGRLEQLILNKRYKECDS